MNSTANKIECDIAAVFFDGKKLNEAIKAVLDLGVKKENISLLCSEQAITDKLKDDFAAVELVADNNSIERFVAQEGTASTVSATVGGLSIVATAVGGGAVVASAGLFGGAIAAATAATVAVGGIGVLAGTVISKSDVDMLQNELDAGHILLIVRTGEDRLKDQVVEVLSKVSEVEAKVLEPA